MAAKTISMQQLRRIIQLSQNGLSTRAISRQTGISRPTVNSYLKRLKNTVSDCKDLLELNDEELYNLLFDQVQDKKLCDNRYIALQDQLALFASELKRTGVTKELLWTEYRLKNSNGYSYSQFCFHLQRFIDNKKTVMHLTHTPGEKIEFDYAGSTLSYFNSNNEEIRCQVFVCVLPYSGYTYVEAMESQRIDDFAYGLQSSLRYFGGVPKTMVGDNFKSCVKRADKYEPELTDLMDQICLHFNTAIIPARVRKPRDKPSVEKSVELTYQRIFAPLRNRKFYSLRELNAAIREQLEKHNNRKFRNCDLTRKEWFDQFEKQSLSELPKEDFVIKKSVSAKVQKNYHVVLGEDWHFYSVPYQYVGKQTTIIYTRYHVEIYCEHKRIAVHNRKRLKNGYTTIGEHMPENHQHYAITSGWDTEYFINWAERISPVVKETIKKMLESRLVAQQSYRACMGLLLLEKKYSKERLIKACEMALRANSVSYKIISGILKNNRDHLNPSEEITLFPNHENIRGADFYNR